MIFETDFMKLYEELGMLNEAYNIPYSGWVVVNEDGEYFSKDFIETGNLRKAWTDDIREAAVYKDENEAYKAQTYCFHLYNEKLDFWARYVESESELEQGEIEKKLFEILELWEDFINTGVAFQKLCNRDNFKDFNYSASDYKNKKPVPNVLVDILTSDDNVGKIARNLGTFTETVCKASKRTEEDPELSKKVRDFAQAWNLLVQKGCQGITMNLRLQIVELLKNI